MTINLSIDVWVASYCLAIVNNAAMNMDVQIPLKNILFILFVAVLHLHCCPRAFSSCEEWGLLFSGAWASARDGFSCCRAQALGCSVVVEHSFSCSIACGIFSEQVLNPCPHHWQVDS